MFQATPVTVSVQISGENDVAPVAAYKLGLNITQLRAAVTQGKLNANRKYYSDMRLVAGGIRTFSTSVRENTSGTVYGYYA